MEVIEIHFGKVCYNCMHSLVNQATINYNISVLRCIKASFAKSLNACLKVVPCFTIFRIMYLFRSLLSNVN